MWIINILILGALLFPASSYARSLNTLELIARAYEKGRIDYREALNYRVAALLRQEELLDDYRSKIPIKSATPLLMEARSNRHMLSPENARLLARGRVDTLIDYYGSGVTLLSFMSRDKRFRVHYTTKGEDAVPADDNNRNNVPDYVEKFAEILDHVWEKEINELGYDAPPSDGLEGGDCLLDVYLADIYPFYGLTQIDEGMPASTVYMIFDNDYSSFPSNLNPGGQQEGDMKVTAAHELFHTIQFQITEDILLNGWWMEASATWMEDRIYPEVKDYINYIDYWFKNPDLPLIYFNGSFEYGTALWVKHMTEKYGSKLVYDVWTKIKEGDSALSGVEKALIERSSTLMEELKELRVANVTLTYDDGPLYRTWDMANPIEVTYDITRLNFSTSENISDVTMDLLASLYYSFSAPEGSGSLTIDFTGDVNTGAMVIGFRSSDTMYDATEMVTDMINSGSITIKGFSSSGPYTEVVIIPLNYSTTYSGTFSLTVTYTPASPDGAIFIEEIRPDFTSIITGDPGNGKQQYFPVMRNGSGEQVLESGILWDSDFPLLVSIDDNGLATALNAVTAAITASLTGPSATATLTSSSPAAMAPGAPRNCTIKTSDGRCFIATAAFGSPLHPYVEILREFRDRYLLTTYIGKKVVSLYYLYSPPMAEKLTRHALLRAIVKLYLIPAIIFSGFMIKTTMAEKIIAGVLIMMALVVMKVRGNKRCHAK